MPDGHRACVVVHEGDGDRRTHACGCRILDGAPVNAVVGGLDELGDRGLALKGTLALCDCGRCEPGRDLAGLGATHAVGDREQRRIAHVRVFVAEPPPTGVGDARDVSDPHDSTRSWVSPMRIKSPGPASLADVTGAPLTNVPFVEPRSSTQAPPSAGVICACRLDTYSSSSKRKVEPGPRPIVVASRSVRRRPADNVGLEMTES